MRPASYVADLKPEAVKDEIFTRRSKSSSTTLWGRWIGPQVATTASSALSFQAVQNVRRSRTHPCPWFSVIDLAAAFLWDSTPEVTLTRKPWAASPFATSITSLPTRCANSVIIHGPLRRSEEHTSELQSLMRISYAVFCLKKKKNT